VRKLLLIGALLLLASPSAASAAQPLQVGVGRADITPPTGYYMMGWVRSDGVIQGQNTRLWARAIVLREGNRKVALVTEDLNGIPGGMMEAAANLDRDIGFSQQNVLDSASHTHAAPTSFYNFSTYNTVFMTLRSPTDFNLSGSIDPQLYAFMVRQLALAIRRANSNLGPGKVGWGATQIDNVTQNRSLEAHLYNFGIHLGYGQGSPSMDPRGPLDTIDPAVNVLRVDKLVRRHDVPVGMWSTFADHGTVNKFQFDVFNEDHHGAATHVVEDAIRQAGHVPASQDVVNAYGNSDEGDMSAGLVRSGPAAAQWVGDVEANAFLAAWRQAGRSMQRSPALDWRWTRMCFCGQNTPDGPVADRGAFGLAEFTGSEEGRGPLYDITRIPFEGDHLPNPNLPPAPALPAGLNQPIPISGPQGDKINSEIPLTIPAAVPMMAIRVGSRLIGSIPGEMTVEMGRRVRAAMLAASGGSGITTAVISGLANEYTDYFTTPQEYDAQHYEGAATAYGRTSSDALEQTLVALTSALVHGQSAPSAYPYDPQNGVSPNAAPFPTGPSSATVVSQPSAATRLSHPAFSWQGGPRGYDRPVDGAFVAVQRYETIRIAVRRRRARPHRHRHRSAPAFTARSRVVHRWVTVQSDLGLEILWTVDKNGVYRAEWEPPYNVKVGTYRFQVTANHYRLTSRQFTLGPTGALTARRVNAPAGEASFELDYPDPEVREAVGDPPGDLGAGLTYRPATASAGTMTVLVNGRAVRARVHDGQFTVPAPSGSTVELRPGGGHDPFGNFNGNDVSF
jgi:neutral ceramidase